MYLSILIVSRFLRASIVQTLSEEPNFHWCSRNGKGCGSGQLHENPCPHFTCGECGYQKCVVHNSEWHRDETCEEYDQRTRPQKRKDRKKQEKKETKEKLSAEHISKTTKPCPGCGKRIEKADGCNHMKCSVCRHEFCWKCLASLTEDVVDLLAHHICAH